ncbi:rRNA maturation RNase YbeY [soil metagenome]
MANINVFIEDIQFTLKDKKLLKNWIKQIIIAEDKKLNELNFIFCSDEYLHTINLQFLNHDTYTDIITFDRSENFLEISGDIYISIERLIDNSRKFSVSFLHELYRVIAHGVLHLLGFSDKESKEKEIMTLKENECLLMWDKLKSST